MSIVTWVDRAQSTDGYFDLNAGYLLCEIDGETYAVSGRYAGIPDTEEAQQLVCSLHEERFSLGFDRYEYEVTVVCKRKRCVKATGYTFKRFTT